MRLPTPTQAERRFRALVVSVATFVAMFGVGLGFIHYVSKINAPAPHVIAKSYLLHTAELRHAPSLSSSVIDKAVPGTNVDLTGFRAGDQDQRWMALDWNNAPAYVLASELAAPKVIDLHEGANTLKFYLSGMETSESVDEAVKEVDYYTQAFPGDVHGEELRWVLAERVRYLSQQGGPAETDLRHQARQQYEKIAASNGRFSDKARDELMKMASSPEVGAQQQRRRSNRKVDALQVNGGSGT